MKYTFTPTSEKHCRAYGSGLRISTKHSVTVCRILSGMNMMKGKRLLENLVAKKSDLDGKYYTNTAKEMLALLKSAESNAEFKGLDTEKLIIFASAHRGFTFFRPRRMKMRRDKRKVTNLQFVLVQK